LAEKILVLGGYGVFGGRLARRLVKETSAEIFVAGRSWEKAEAFCREHGGTPMALDRDGDLDAALQTLRPDVVVDAAGPFQAYGSDPYRGARAAIACGAHYVDLADDAAFVAGIGALDGQARQAGLSVISGASSVPAISSSALDELTKGMASVALVTSTILPGNRAPRGLSVVRSITGQAGRPLLMWRGGRWNEEPAWGGVRRMDLTIDDVAPVRGRLASPIGAPDLLMFAERYGARSVVFSAGLDLKLMHLGLWALAWPVRLGLVPSLLPLAPALKWLAERLESFGSDRGGMIVRAVGRTASGEAVERSWTLIAEEGDGPDVPPTPALLLCRRLLGAPPPRTPPYKGEGSIEGSGAPWQPNSPSPPPRGEELRLGVRTGAYPAIGVLSLGDIEAGLSTFRISFGRCERPATPLLEQALGQDAKKMPWAWRRLADIHDIDHFAGEASVTRGEGLLSRMVGGLFGFPAASDRVAVEVTKQKTGKGERWTRRFAGKPFRSHLSRLPGDGPGVLRERFGPFSFVMHLRVVDGRVEWPVVSWRWLGIPMPVALMPRSETCEYVDDVGHFRFDVGISVPMTGQIVRYRGWLAPV
jgi:hypothetical protein